MVPAESHNGGPKNRWSADFGPGANGFQCLRDRARRDHARARDAQSPGRKGRAVRHRADVSAGAETRATDTKIALFAPHQFGKFRLRTGRQPGATRLDFVAPPRSRIPGRFPGVCQLGGAPGRERLDEDLRLLDVLRGLRDSPRRSLGAALSAEPGFGGGLVLAPLARAPGAFARRGGGLRLGGRTAPPSQHEPDFFDATEFAAGRRWARAPPREARRDAQRMVS